MHFGYFKQYSLQERFLKPWKSINSLVEKPSKTLQQNVSHFLDIRRITQKVLKMFSKKTIVLETCSSSVQNIILILAKFVLYAVEVTVFRKTGSNFMDKT